MESEQCDSLAQEVLLNRTSWIFSTCSELELNEILFILESYPILAYKCLQSVNNLDYVIIQQSIALLPPFSFLNLSSLEVTLSSTVSYVILFP